MEFQTWQDSSPFADNVWELEGFPCTEANELVYWHQSYYRLLAKKDVHAAADVPSLL